MPFMRAPNCATGPRWDEDFQLYPAVAAPSIVTESLTIIREMRAPPVDSIEAVQQVRRFNRTVTEGVGALDDHFLGRGRPLGEARLLWEIGPDGIEIRALRARLGLDS